MLIHPYFEPQTWDILGEGYCSTGRTTLPLPVLTPLVHPLTQDLHSWGATPGPRDISCRRLCSVSLYRPSNLEYIGRGVLLNRENHPPFTSLDPAGTFSTKRSFTVGARPRAHEIYRVADYARSPLFRTSILGYIGQGVLLNRENHPPFTSLDPTVTRPPQLGRDPGPTRHIVAAIMLVPPLSTLRPRVYWSRGTVEQGEPPSLY